MKFYEYKYEKSISNDMKLLTFNSNKYTSYYDQPSADIIKWIPLKSPEKHSHASQFTKHLSFMTLKGDTLLQIQECGMPCFLTFANIYQQTSAVNHTNHSDQNITTSLNFSSHQTHILNFQHQKKTIKQYQYHSEFILSKITPSTHQKHQNFMSKSSHT